MRPVSRFGPVVLIVLRLLMAFVILFPLLYAVSVSFMTIGEVFKKPPTFIPSSFSLVNYYKAMRTFPFLQFLKNSFIMSIGITIGQLILASLAAFSFTHFKFRGKQFVFMAILVTMMIPGESIVISNYMTIGDLGLFDTYTALILPSTASALAVFFLRQSFLLVPESLYEASIIDGCSNLRYFLQILLPLSKGQIYALGVYIYISSWNQYLWPLLITNKDYMRTVQIGIGMLRDTEAQAPPMIMAGIIITLLPSILVFFIGQKRILSGMFAGAIKG